MLNLRAPVCLWCFLRFRGKGGERRDGRTGGETGANGGVWRYGTRAILARAADFSRAIVSLDHGKGTVFYLTMRIWLFYCRTREIRGTTTARLIPSGIFVEGLPVGAALVICSTRLCGAPFPLACHAASGEVKLKCCTTSWWPALAAMSPGEGRPTCWRCPCCVCSMITTESMLRRAAPANTNVLV